MFSDSAVVLNKVGNALIVTLQTTLTDEVLNQFQARILSKISEVKVSYIVCDLSGMELIDMEEYASITTSLKMAAVMGVKTIIVGLNPGVAAMIVDSDLDCDSFKYALNIEQGLSLAKQ
ncbi:STAS domain-containing protein [Vibrio maerlii]|uniref:STAS domain-containing protein n=1 Tax=Vibrio maerlii TaxID=2231648 RepID=UPI000E3CAFE1|nr:STAS domain-containing protein [Vibrio maerlii]